MPQQASSFHQDQELSADTQFAQFAGGSSESEFWRILVALLLHIEQIQPEHKNTQSLPPSLLSLGEGEYKRGQ
jgi:hypothetical protein